MPEMTPKEIPWLGVLQRDRMRLGKELNSSWGILASRNRARKPLVFSVWVFKIAIFEEWSLFTMLLEKQSHGCEINRKSRSQTTVPNLGWEIDPPSLSFFINIDNSIYLKSRGRKSLSGLKGEEFNWRGKGHNNLVCHMPFGRHGPEQYWMI